MKGARAHPWLLRGDRVATWAWGTGKTLAGITGAALKPVPAAVSTGWKSGRERHRNRAGNRPVPVALDPPWWRREQATEQASGTGQERAPEQTEEQSPDRWRVLLAKGRRGYEGHILLLDQHPDLPEQYVAKIPGRTPEDVREGAEWLIGEEQRDSGKGRPHEIQWVDQEADLIFPSPTAHPSGIPPEQRCQWCDDRPQETKRGKLAVCSPCGEEIDGQIATAQSLHQPIEASGWPLMSRVSEIPDCDIHSQIQGVRGVPAAYDAETKSGAWAFMCPDCFKKHGPGALGLGVGQRLVLRETPTDPPLKTDPDPTDTTTEQPTTPTEGDPVFTSLDTDLDDLTTVQDFALKVADMAEESDFAQLVEFCKNASDEVRDFGADMAADVAEFEEVAAKIGDLLSELVDAAQKVKDRGAELVGG